MRCSRFCSDYCRGYECLDCGNEITGGAHCFWNAFKKLQGIGKDLTDSRIGEHSRFTLFHRGRTRGDDCDHNYVTVEKMRGYKRLHNAPSRLHSTRILHLYHSLRTSFAMSLQSGAYRIISKIDNKPVGRLAHEDKSLLPKKIVVLPEDAPTSTVVCLAYFRCFSVMLNCSAVDFREAG